MPQMSENMNLESKRPGKNSGNTLSKDDGSSSNLNTRRIYVEKGIESDYYIEIISDEITEGMEVVIPKTESDFNNIQNMMMRQGPMGGF